MSANMFNMGTRVPVEPGKREKVLSEKRSFLDKFLPEEVNTELIRKFLLGVCDFTYLKNHDIESHKRLNDLYEEYFRLLSVSGNNTEMELISEQINELDWYLSTMDELAEIPSDEEYEYILRDMVESILRLFYQHGCCSDPVKKIPLLLYALVSQRDDIRQHLQAEFNYSGVSTLEELLECWKYSKIYFVEDIEGSTEVELVRDFRGQIVTEPSNILDNLLSEGYVAFEDGRIVVNPELVRLFRQADEVFL